jgi:excisionase family DNA binding protein
MRLPIDTQTVARERKGREGCSSRCRTTTVGSARRSETVATNQPLLDVGGAASRLGCSERFIRRLVMERRIPFVKLGGTKVRFVASDLEEWITDQRIDASR